jgi:D-alanine-D-alanine ligase
MNKKLNVAVLFGGISPEHEVSIITGIQIVKALDKKKYTAVPVYITKQGEWFKLPINLKVKDFIDTSSVLKSGEKVFITPNPGNTDLIPYKQIDSFISTGKGTTHIDVFFPAFHGNNGEDGAIQGLLKLKSATYVGCNVQSSAIGIDKIASKMIAKSLDIPVIPDVWFSEYDWNNRKNTILNQIQNTLGFPVYVKPVRLGSSIAVTRVENKNDLINAIKVVFFYDRRVIVEKSIENNREINISIVGNDPYELSLTEELVKTEQTLSFKEKYMADPIKSKGKEKKGMAGMNRIAPAQIRPSTQKKIQDYSTKFFKEIDGKGISRLDFILSKNEKEIYFNEINTLPGSISFYLWQPKGMSIRELTDKLIQLSIEENAKEEKTNTVFKSNILKSVNKLNSKKF